jgi:hypothetical protein
LKPFTNPEFSHSPSSIKLGTVQGAYLVKVQKRGLRCQISRVTFANQRVDDIQIAVQSGQ